LHLSDLPVHGGPNIQAVDLALQVRHQVLLSIEQRLLAVDVESILLGLRLVIHFRLFERKLCLFQRVLNFERLQLGVRAQFVLPRSTVAIDSRERVPKAPRSPRLAAS
jgi:hypothetical protein